MLLAAMASVNFSVKSTSSLTYAAVLEYINGSLFAGMWDKLERQTRTHFPFLSINSPQSCFPQPCSSLSSLFSRSALAP